MNGCNKRIRHFTDLEVWGRAHSLFLQLMKDLEHLPSTRPAMVLTDQVLRSSGSVCANIAEGFNRSKSKYLCALDIALGEAHETENWLYKLRDSGLLAAEEANGRIRESIAIGKMISSLTRAIRRMPDRRDLANNKKTKASAH